MLMPEFRPDQTAHTAHAQLRESLKISEQANHCALLWFAEISRRNLHRDLGYSSMRAYAMQELGFSSAKAGDFMRLTARLDELPVLKNDLVAGKIGYTTAREILPVVDQTNEKEWVELARGSSRRGLRDSVKHAKQVAARHRAASPAQTELLPAVPSPVPAAQPHIRVEFSLTPGQYALYEAQLAKAGPRRDRAELLLEMVGALLAMEAEKVAPRGATSEPHYHVHVHQCPDCSRATVASPRGEVELSPSEIDAANCDATVHRPDQPNKSTIPPSTRRDVLTRDRHQCRRKGCSHTRHLDLHHVVQRRDGGTNDEENLVTLCPACHRLWHERGGEMREMLREVG